MSPADTVLALEVLLAPDARTHFWACEQTPDACPELVPSWALTADTQNPLPARSPNEAFLPEAPGS